MHSNSSSKMSISTLTPKKIFYKSQELGISNNRNASYKESFKFGVTWWYLLPKTKFSFLIANFIFVILSTSTNWKLLKKLKC